MTNTSEGPPSEDTGVPAAKLGSLTRKRNEIEELLSSSSDNIDAISKHFTEYLVRLEELQMACDSDARRKWLESHMDTITRFRCRVENIIHPPSTSGRAAGSRAIRSASVKSNHSAVSSALILLAQQKARASAQKFALDEAEKLAAEELDLKRRELQLEQRRKRIEQQEREKEVEALELELQKIDSSPMYSDSLDNVLVRPAAHLPGVRESFAEQHERFYDPVASSVAPGDSLEGGKQLLSILERQNEISLTLAQSHERALLPKKDIQIFTGEDVTKYKCFITNFNRAIVSKCQNDADKLLFLEQYTAGKAQKLVQSCNHFNASKGFAKAIELLNAEYGNEFKVANAYIEKLQQWPSIKNEDCDALEDFAIYLLNCYHYLENMSSSNQLENPKEIMNIVRKLPYKVRERWRRRTHAQLAATGQVKFKLLVDFVQEEASVIKQPLFGCIADEPSESKRKINLTEKSRKVFATAANEIKDKFSKSQLICECCRKTNHTINNCFFFKRKSAVEKIKFVDEAGLCFSCLERNHKAKNCSNRVNCQVCHRQHPTVLHDMTKNTSIGESSEGPSEAPDDSVITPEDIHTRCSKRSNFSGAGATSKTICPILPAKVRIKNGTKDLLINVALDNCSSDCWVNEDLLDQLGIKAASTRISLTTMHSKNRDSSTKVVNNLLLSDVTGNNVAQLPVVYTKPGSEWPFSRGDLPTYSDVEKLSHLRHVPFNFVDADIHLLIGMNAPELLMPLEVVHGDEREPYASLHSLGWTLNGPVDRKGETSANFRTTVTGRSNLENLIENYFSQDFIDKSMEMSMSETDKQWQSIVDSSATKLQNGHYQIDLPFKNKDVSFPSNRQQIMNKFHITKRRLERNPEFASDYHKFVNGMIENNFVEKVPSEELSQEPGKVWYLAHHGVYHKQKRKLRVVFDCSLRFAGVSLNDQLLPGPDLTNNLIGVLLRFRQSPWAFTGDIEKMYYQVRVPKKHANFMRFFWFDLNSGAIAEYRLRVHVFGATSSPSVANFALRQTADDDILHSDEAKKTIRQNFYVDDLLKSTETVEEAISLKNEVTEIVSSGKFNLTSFSSNSSEFMETVVKPPASIERHELGCHLSSDKALGVAWNTGGDTLGFSVNLTSSNQITRRKLLSTIASIYDPLGIASPVFISPKRIFQETCRLKLNWDDALPRDLQEMWINWVENTKTLPTYTIPRCIKPLKGITSLELHVFCDGSETAYGAVAYLRLSHSSNLVTSLVYSKARLTPINNSTLKTVPRIELCSAKLAVDIAHKLQQELELDFGKPFFWSDSVTVLRYIKNKTKRFQRFVGNKVSYIKNFSDANQWFYVPTSENPADLISRGTGVALLKDSSLWNRGPIFLHSRAAAQPKQNYDPNLELNDREVKLETRTLTSVVDGRSPLDHLMESSSSWHNLKKRVAWLLRLKDLLRYRTKMSSTTDLVLSELHAAEKVIVQYLQRKHYSEIMSTIRDGSALPKNISLRKLFPCIDKEGLLRVGGRIDNAPVAYDVKHPIILPGKSFITELLVRQAHHTVGHLGRAAVLAELRKRFWIVNANSVVRKTVRNCLACRKRQGRPSQQLMAELPEKRVAANVPAFSDTGVDYFGPFVVKHGRKTEKRYGVIFTCLSSRAVHLEVAESLTTDSFIGALRRFIGRRGNVRSLTSDNGTNFKGAYKELKDAISDWNQKVIANWMKQKHIIWNFHPPTASHFGGVWERLIRTVRQVLSALMNEQPMRLNHEELSTLLCEVEAILNNRPLTEISSDPLDFEPLTPNHLLLLNAGVTFPPGLFKNTDIYVRRRWKQVQYLADLFWTRWRKEYLVLLQERQKWTCELESLREGDLVLVQDYQLPRNQWPLGRIVETHKDKYSRVRSAKIKICKTKTSTGFNFECSVVERPISKLILLRSVRDL